MKRSQRERLKTIIRSLGKLQNEINNPEVLEFLSNASFDLYEALKFKQRNGRRYSKEIAFKAAMMYQRGVLLKLISEECGGIGMDNIRKIAKKLNIPGRYKTNGKVNEKTT